MSSTTHLGPLVRLEGISIKQLPAGGKPTSNSTPAPPEKQSTPPPITPDLKLFLTNVLIEAIPFIDTAAPKSETTASATKQWKPKGSSKKYASSEGAVSTYERIVSGKELDKVAGLNQFREDGKSETWYCRISSHRNAAEKGTANWEEFKSAFKDNHPATEDAFTPTVIGAREAIIWDCSGIEIDLNAEKWIDLTLTAVEMKHKIDPKPLKNRTFPIIQITASLSGTQQEFIVVSIPITDFEKSPYSEFAKDKSLVVAAYVSIERIRVVPGSGEIEWVMATASDAGGVLPQWIQNLAVPGLLPKDVEMFMGASRPFHCPIPCYFSNRKYSAYSKWKEETEREVETRDIFPPKGKMNPKASFSPFPSPPQNPTPHFQPPTNPSQWIPSQRPPTTTTANSTSTTTTKPLDTTIPTSNTNKSLPSTPAPGPGISETASLSTIPPPPISKTAEEGEK